MIASFNQAIKFHADTIESLQKALQANTDLVAAAQMQLNDISNRLQTVDKMNEEETARREKEAASHAKKIEEFDEALATVGHWNLIVQLLHFFVYLFSQIWIHFVAILSFQFNVFVQLLQIRLKSIL